MTKKLGEAAQRRVMWVIAEVCPRFGVDAEDVFSPLRSQSVAAARQYAMATCYLAFGWSMPEVGRLFDRDHTTVLSALRKLKGQPLLGKLVIDARQAFRKDILTLSTEASTGSGPTDRSAYSYKSRA